METKKVNSNQNSKDKNKSGFAKEAAKTAGSAAIGAGAVFAADALGKTSGKDDPVEDKDNQESLTEDDKIQDQKLDNQESLNDSEPVIEINGSDLNGLEIEEIETAKVERVEEITNISGEEVEELEVVAPVSPAENIQPSEISTNPEELAVVNNPEQIDIDQPENIPEEIENVMYGGPVPSEEEWNRIDEEIYGGPVGWEDFNSDDLLSSNDNDLIS